MKNNENDLEGNSLFIRRLMFQRIVIDEVTNAYG
jgi:hypothetical protein